MKRAYKPLLILAVGIIIGWFIRGSQRPNYPSNWDLVHLGMSESAALSIVPDLTKTGMRELKGFDQVSVDYGDCYWSLQVTYDEAEAVASVQKQYVDRNWGFRRKTLRLPVD